MRVVGDIGGRAGRSAFLAAALLAAISCARKAPAPPPPPAVGVAPVIQRDVPVTAEWVGSLDGYVNAEIRPQVDGYVLRQHYKEGTFVRRGALLFEIDARQLQAALDQAKGDLARNEAALAKARLDVARFAPLVADKAVSGEELDNARTAERQAQASVEAARAAAERSRLNVGWTRVESPIDGVAGIAKSQVGNLVTPQTLMTTVSQVDPIKVYFSPSEQEYLHWAQNGGLISVGRKGALRLVLSDGSVYPQPGDPLLQDRNIDPRTGTLQVAGVFPNPDRILRPGQYAKVRAVTRVRKGAILVPQRAVSELQGSFQVAVVLANNTVEIRSVETAERIGPLWVVTKGLAPGERVVVEGTQKVRAGSVVDPRPVPAEPTPGSGAPGTPVAGSVAER
jgi:RND family efflux transporter MFP subunit